MKTQSIDKNAIHYAINCRAVLRRMGFGFEIGDFGRVGNGRKGMYRRINYAPLSERATKNPNTL